MTQCRDVRESVHTEKAYSRRKFLGILGISPQWARYIDEIPEGNFLAQYRVDFYTICGYTKSVIWVAYGPDKVKNLAKKSHVQV
jgi:hypothetical protein